MKSCIPAILIFVCLLISIPSVPMLISKADFKEESSVASPVKETEPENSSEGEDKISTSEEPYLMLDITTGKVEEISQLEYITGAVCAEMPAAFETEALKAQAVAAHTYAERQRLRELENPTKELCGAYFSNDSKKYQAYFTENQAKQYYGESYDMNMEKIRKAVKEVQDEILVYEQQPIIAAFHSMSGGTTESAENVWGSRVDYLVPVSSKDDTGAPRYLDELELTAEEMRERIESAFSGIALEDDPTKWFGEPETSKSGTVLKIRVGDKEDASGQEVRSALSLRSAIFDIKYDNGFKITTKGYGHCVGMSQYGANSMAQEGKSYKEILAHYYPGTELESFSLK